MELTETLKQLGDGPQEEVRKESDVVRIGLVGPKNSGKRSFMQKWINMEKTDHITKKSSSQTVIVHSKPYVVQFFVIEPEVEDLTKVDFAVADGYIFFIPVDSYHAFDYVQQIHYRLVRHYSSQSSNPNHHCQNNHPMKMVSITESQAQIEPSVNEIVTAEDNRRIVLINSTESSKGQASQNLLDEKQIDQTLSKQSLFSFSSLKSKKSFDEDLFGPKNQLPTRIKSQQQQQQQHHQIEIQPQQKQIQHNKKKGEMFPKLFVGSKCDILDRSLGTKDLIKFADECNTSYFEISTVLMKGIDMAVEEIVKKVIEERKKEFIKNVELNYKNSKPPFFISSKDEEDDFLDIMRKSQK